MPSTASTAREQVGELRPVLPGAEVAAVGVDVLAEQRDLDARRRRRARSTSWTMSPMRRLTSAPRTIGTMQNAHELSQPIWIVTHAACSTLAPRRQRRRVRLVLLEDLDDRALDAGALASRPGACARLWVPKTTSTWPARSHDALAVLLGQAPADRDLQAGPSLLQRLEAPEVAVELVVGVLTDAARVEDDDVGRLEVVGRLHALGREQPGDALRVVLVHLAPVGAHVEAARARVDRRGGSGGHGRPVYGPPIAPRLGPAGAGCAAVHLSVTASARSALVAILVGAVGAGLDRLRAEPARRSRWSRSCMPEALPGDRS